MRCGICRKPANSREELHDHINRAHPSTSGLYGEYDHINRVHPPTSGTVPTYNGPVNRHWSIDLTCREDYIEATISHMPTGEQETKRIEYANYQDGIKWSRQYEAQADLFSWMADRFSRVGEDDEYPGQYDPQSPEDDDHGPADSSDGPDRDEYEPGGSRFD